MKYKYLSGQEIELLSDFRNLAGENLSEVEIQDADFTHEKFTDTNFYGSDLTGSDFSNSYLKNCDFTDAVLDRTRFRGVTGVNCKFQNASFVRSEFTYGRFNTCSFEQANLLETVFSFVDLERSWFNKASAVNTSFLNCFMRDATFYDLEVDSPVFMWNVLLNFETFAKGAISSDVVQFLKKQGARLVLEGDIEYWTHHFGGRL